MRRLLALAAAALLVFGGLQLLGFREDVAVLSGSRVASVVGGVAYALSYFAAVVGVPVVMLAAGGLEALRRFTSRARSRQSPSRPSGSP
jgi:hypothetical protein